mmetsp:Transcript_69362/g.111842  ORF Transcript_69362/g.111842 Transcript_69362/m.111842 type:complete len:100 (+) Transcript_69362:2-301(+)
MEWWRVFLYAFGLCTICCGMAVLCRSEFKAVKEDSLQDDNTCFSAREGEDAKDLGLGATTTTTTTTKITATINADIEESKLDEQSRIGNCSKSKTSVSL